MTCQSIHMYNAALDEIATMTGKMIVLRGVLDPSSLVHLKIAEYQREGLPNTSLKELRTAIKDGNGLPDIELGMRGQRFSSVDDKFCLYDPVYAIDGQQRRNACLQVLEEDPSMAVKIRLGAMVHFDTTVEWERERFQILNGKRTKVSPNILLKNLRHTNNGLLTIYGMSRSDDKFPLVGRVTWTQRMQPNDLISAMGLLRSTLILHGGTRRGGSVIDVAGSLTKMVDQYGLNKLRSNTITFFNLIDDCWEFSKIQSLRGAVQVKQVFLTSLAKVIYDHLNFWRGSDRTILHFDHIWRSKIASLPIYDPFINNLIIAGGTGCNLVLSNMIVEQLNKGNRSNFLVRRDGSMSYSHRTQKAEEEAAEEEEFDGVDAETMFREERTI